MTMNDDISYTMACYLIDGFNINCKAVTGTTLKRVPPEDGSGFRAWVEMAEHGTEMECMSRLGWLEAAEGAVRQALWYLSENKDA